MVHRLAIIGLGLMGGAVGLATRKSGAATRVIGVGDKPETVERARLMGAVDEATLNLREGVQDADMVLLAVPVSMISEIANAVIPYCREGTVITDIGSSKATIVDAVEKLIQHHKSHVYFVGSHPIAGSDKTGIDAAHEVKLADAPCVVTSTAATDGDAWRKVEDFWKALGMKTMRLPPAEHDAVLARSSHLTHLLAYALITVQNERSMQLSGPGLRDVTRLAGSDVALWTDIFAQNAGEILRALKEYMATLQELAEELEQLAGAPEAEAARERIFRFLADAKQRHDARFTQEPAAGNQTPRSQDTEIRSRDTQVIT